LYVFYSFLLLIWMLCVWRCLLSPCHRSSFIFIFFKIVVFFSYKYIGESFNIDFKLRDNFKIIVYIDRKQEQNNGLSIAVKKIMKRFSLFCRLVFFVFSICQPRKIEKEGKNLDKGRFDVTLVVNQYQYDTFF